MLSWLRKFLAGVEHDIDERAEKRAGVMTSAERDQELDRHAMLEQRLREKYGETGTGKFKVQQ